MIRRSLPRFQTSVKAEAFHKNADARPEAQHKRQALLASIDSSLANAPDGDLALRYYDELLAQTIAKPLTVPRLAELMLPKFLTRSPFVALYHFLTTNALGGDIDVAMELVRMCGLSNSASLDDGEMVFVNTLQPGTQIILNEEEGPGLDDEYRHVNCHGNVYHRGPTPIVIALVAGRLDLVERIIVDQEFKPKILSKKFNVNYTETSSLGWRRGHDYGCDVIQLCVKYGMHEAVSLDVIALLIAHGADVNGSGGSSPLLMAMDRGWPDVMATMIGLGAKVNVPITSISPLHHAVNKGMFEEARLLLESGADLNALGKVEREEGLFTPLQLAVERNDLQFVELLLASGADPLKCSIIKECPLFYSIVTQYNSEDPEKIFRTLAKHTIQSADEAFLKVLAKEVGFCSYTILQLAAAANDADTIIAFAKAGADPLMGLRLACDRRNYAAVAALVKCGVNARKEFQEFEWNTKVVPWLGDEGVK